MNREQMIARSGKSHLERLFAGALWDAGWRYAKEPDHARGFFGEVEFAWDPPTHSVPCNAVPQCPIEVDGATYVCDMVFVADFGWVVVELDGHAFHERTPEQASRDRAMDRAIQLRGSYIFRFTHRELTRYMAACIADIDRALRRIEHDFLCSTEQNHELFELRFLAEENGLDAPPRWRSEVERLQLRTAKRRGR